MSDAARVPTSFESLQSDRPLPIIVRPGVDLAEARPILERIAAVRWVELWHAYGPAGDVPNQLAAITVGDDETRDAAWWDLWGNIHHQGTIYEATVPAVPILGDLASWNGYPDRPQVLWFLREVAAAPGVVVWRYGEEDDIVHDGAEEAKRWEELRRGLDEATGSVFDSWRHEPEAVQRALVYLLTALPHERRRRVDLVEEVLPSQYREAWRQSFSESGLPMTDEIDAFESWVHTGVV